MMRRPRPPSLSRRIARTPPEEPYGTSIGTGRAKEDLGTESSPSRRRIRHDNVATVLSTTSGVLRYLWWPCEDTSGTRFSAHPPGLCMPLPRHFYRPTPMAWLWLGQRTGLRLSGREFSLVIVGCSESKASSLLYKLPGLSGHAVHWAASIYPVNFARRTLSYGEPWAVAAAGLPRPVSATQPATHCSRYWQFPLLKPHQNSSRAWWACSPLGLLHRRSLLLRKRLCYPVTPVPCHVPCRNLVHQPHLRLAPHHVRTLRPLQLNNQMYKRWWMSGKMCSSPRWKTCSVPLYFSQLWVPLFWGTRVPPMIERHHGPNIRPVQEEPTDAPGSELFRWSVRGRSRWKVYPEATQRFQCLVVSPMLTVTSV